MTSASFPPSYVMRLFTEVLRKYLREHPDIEVRSLGRTAHGWGGGGVARELFKGLCFFV